MLLHLRRKSRWLLLIFLLALALLLLGLRAAAPEWARHELLKRLNEKCPACRFEVRGLELGVLSGLVVARGVGFLSDPKDGTHFGATAEALTVKVRLSSLLGHAPWVELVRIEGMDLIVADYAHSKPNTEPPSYPFIGRLPTVRVEKLEVRGSKFTYALDPPGQQRVPNPANIPGTVSVAEALARKKHFAYLKFHAIDADFGPIGTKRGISPQFVNAAATASQGGKAKVRVEVRLGLFENEKIDDIDILVRNADLSEINTMFGPTEGVRIQGLLHQGKARIEVRKRKLTSTVQLEYGGLKVKYLKGHEGRSRFKTFLSNVVSGVMVDEQKLANNSKGKSKGTATLVQKPFDNVFSFLRDGLRDSVKKVASSG
jgi:hypothetical protein